MSTAYLVTHPPASAQYRKPRREAVSGVIVRHSAENVPDLSPPDTGALAVARFIEHRPDPGSYHTLSDSDDWMQVVPFEWEAFHDGTGTNRHSIGLSIAMRADQWDEVPQVWADYAVMNMARAAVAAAAYVKATTGIVVPARHITAAEARAKVPGFVDHAQLDPSRRTDPGGVPYRFPDDDFLALFAEFTHTPPPPDLEDPAMAIGTSQLDDRKAEVVDAYWTYCYRAPTTEERDLWVWQLGLGATLESVKTGIATSKEATEKRAKVLGTVPILEPHPPTETPST